jgi:polyphosphate kinase
VRGAPLSLFRFAARRFFRLRHSLRAEASGDLLNAELSLLAFQWRVLAMAEDPATPLRERLRFLGIVSSNVDELYMVRMASLRREARGHDAEREEPADDGLDPRHRLARIEDEVAALVRAMSRCAHDCLRAAEALGTRLFRWDELSDRERQELRRRCRDEIHPGLTPLAMTLSPGHPLPHLPHLGLSIAVVFRDESGGRPRLAEFELPHDVPRLLEIPGRAGAVLAIEELLRANVDLLHPHAHVESVHLFRVTRSGDLILGDDAGESLLESVADATLRRPYNVAVRVEMERSAPTLLGGMILESLRRDAVAQGREPLVDEVSLVDGLLDLRCLADLPLPMIHGIACEPLRTSTTETSARSMLDRIADGDLLAHHPFDAFDETVVRFLDEAADDPAVTTIKITLYRVGDPSPVVAALLRAACSGKRVVAFVELQARFDEEHNVLWARLLESAGGNVVYGLAGLKTHAKVALVVRREGERLRQYVHVGTGNYNVRSGRQYTDLSLFSAREELVADVADLFNALTGSSRSPGGLSRGALVAPHQLLPAILELIDGEVAHARAGRPASIAVKVNGLSDSEVVHALYRAADAGVRIDLVVRGICTLRPRQAERGAAIRVVSVVGRLLEHSRIYRFENGGAPLHFIGSSDLRPRNLRRRVELLVPVTDDAHRTRLDHIMASYLGDATGWDLERDGRYVQRDRGAPGAQAIFGA